MRSKEFLTKNLWKILMALRDEDRFSKIFLITIFVLGPVLAVLVNNSDIGYGLSALISIAILVWHFLARRLDFLSKRLLERRYDVITDTYFWLLNNKNVKKPLLVRRILVPEAVLEELKRVAIKDFWIWQPAQEARRRIKELEAEGALEVIKTKPTDERIRDERAQEPWRRGVIELIYQTHGKRKLAVFDPILRREIERWHWRSGLEFIPTLPKEFRDFSGSKFERFLLVPIEEKA